MNDKQSSELRLLATIVWDIWRPEDKEIKERLAAEQEKRVERFRLELQRIIGKSFDINITNNVGCIEAIIDDLHFIAYEIASSESTVPTTLVTLLGRCPSCGVETMSRPFYHLAGLGKLLENFEPLFHHICFHYRGDNI